MKTIVFCLGLIEEFILIEIMSDLRDIRFNDLEVQNAIMQMENLKKYATQAQNSLYWLLKAPTHLKSLFQVIRERGIAGQQLVELLMNVDYVETPNHYSDWLKLQKDALYEVLTRSDLIKSHEVKTLAHFFHDKIEAEYRQRYTVEEGLDEID